MAENFEDLEFQGTKWYLAEDVDKKLAEYKSKADAWDGIKPLLPELFLEQLFKLIFSSPDFRRELSEGLADGSIKPLNIVIRRKKEVN